MSTTGHAYTITVVEHYDDHKYIISESARVII